MTSGNRRPEDMGGMGESYFRLLAKDAGLVANPSSDDKAGWDFEVEDSNPLVINYANQSRPVYRVQVKATMSESLSIAMTFSSLISLIQYAGPAFIFLIKFGKELIPETLRIIHIDENLAIEILTNLRKKEVKNKAIKLNKAKFSVRFDPTISLTENTGPELRRYLESKLNGGYLNYLDCKMKWLREIEKNSTALRANIRFESMESLRGMADCFLGYETPFNVTSTIFRAPLGISDELTTHPPEFGPTTIKPIISELPRATVRLRTSPYGSIYEFKAIIYSVPLHLPKEFAAIRIHTSLFDIIYRFEYQNAEFKVADLFDKDLTASVTETRGFVRYIGEVIESKTTLLEISLDDNEGPPLKLSIETRASRLNEDYDAVREATEALFLKLSTLGLSRELMRPADIFDKHRRVNFLQHVGNKYNPPFSFEFSTNNKVLNKAEVVIFNTEIILIGKTVIFFAAFYGNIKKISTGKLHGDFLRSEHLGEIVVPAEANIENLRRLYGEKFSDMLRDRGLVVLE